MACLLGWRPGTTGHWLHVDQGFARRLWPAVSQWSAGQATANNMDSLNAGLASQTVAQHQANIGSTRNVLRSLST